MKISIGSTNPAKIDATKEAFKEIVNINSLSSDILIQFESCEVNIPDLNNTPNSIEEMIKGAQIRATTSQRQLKADLGIGLEGGIYTNEYGTFLTAYAVVSASLTNIGIGSAPAIKIPSYWILGKEKSFELGAYVNSLTGQTDAKFNRGAIGILTNNAITRMESLKEAVICAYYSIKNEK